MTARQSDAPAWPSRLKALAAELQSPEPGEDRSRQLEEAWLILTSAIMSRLRRHAARVGGAAREDMEDIAAEKSLDLIRRIESSSWSLEGRAEGEVVRFLGRTAWNGLVDWFRHTGREISFPEGDPPEDSPPPEGGPAHSESPDMPVLRNDFLMALKACVSILRPKAFKIWFFRVFYDMPSLEIARHPDIDLNRGHIDVVLQRCRLTLRECMQKRGFEAGDMPPGSFTVVGRRDKHSSHSTTSTASSVVPSSSSS